MNKYLPCISSLRILENVWTTIRKFRLNALMYSSGIVLLVSLTGCEKQPEFERLKDVSGNYTITKATLFKADNVTDSVSYSNFGSISFSDCKKNSTRSCTGEYKIGNESSVSIRTSVAILKKAN